MYVKWNTFRYSIYAAFMRFPTARYHHMISTYMYHSYLDLYL